MQVLKVKELLAANVGTFYRYSKGGKDDEYIEFCDVGMRFGWCNGIWDSGGLLDSACGLCDHPTKTASRPG
jgi:hypothetical protein